MRIDQCRRSEVDKRILFRRLSCNKQGYYVKARDKFGPGPPPPRKPRPSTKEGCKAMMLAKVNKSGKWAVTRFIKDHTHPLVVSNRPSQSCMVSFYPVQFQNLASHFLCSFMLLSDLVELNFFLLCLSILSSIISCSFPGELNSAWMHIFNMSY